ncbi:MAG: hypothetical protein K2Z81_11430, partial [Cyanobacteria bacterium]|nr:hypothetical protein [Cyanobacteriota bacterium]
FRDGHSERRSADGWIQTSVSPADRRRIDVAYQKDATGKVVTDERGLAVPKDIHLKPGNIKIGRMVDPVTQQEKYQIDVGGKSMTFPKVRVDKAGAVHVTDKLGHHYKLSADAAGGLIAEGDKGSRFRFNPTTGNFDRLPRGEGTPGAPVRPAVPHRPATPAVPAKPELPYRPGTPGLPTPLRPGRSVLVSHSPAEVRRYRT